MSLSCWYPLDPLRTRRKRTHSRFPGESRNGGSSFYRSYVQRSYSTPIVIDHYFGNSSSNRKCCGAISYQRLTSGVTTRMRKCLQVMDRQVPKMVTSYLDAGALIPISISSVSELIPFIGQQPQSIAELRKRHPHSLNSSNKAARGGAVTRKNGVVEKRRSGDIHAAADFLNSLSYLEFFSCSLDSGTCEARGVCSSRQRHASVAGASAAARDFTPRKSIFPVPSTGSAST